MNKELGRKRRIGCAAIAAMLAAAGAFGAYSCQRSQSYQPPAETTEILAERSPKETADIPATITFHMPESEPEPAIAAPTETTALPYPEAENTEPLLPETTETDLPQEETTEPSPSEAPDDPGWNLRLVNSTHPLPDAFDIDLVELSNGVSVDSRIYPDLQRMFDDMRSQGVNPFVREGFRTRDYQQSLMDERRNEYIAQGYNEEDADAMARDYVAEPGTSEHELGLAVDINAAGDTDSWTVYNWLAQHAHEYGFILRYPDGKTDITGIAYEPWHYRYVGTDAAEEIYQKGLTLEEYLGE